MTAPAHGAALADPTVPIILADGSESHFIVTMLTLARIEDEFGSVDEMKKLMDGMDMDKPVFRKLGGIFGLLMEPERTADEALRVLDLRRLSDYTDALSEAFDKAFPDEDEADAPDPTVARVTKGSPGTTGTTSPRSRSGAPKKRSGR